MNMPVMILLLSGLVISAMACVMIRDLLKVAITLAAVSAILSVIMFLLGAHLAAVFELSVCSGLITVVFISAISMTRVISKEESAEKDRARRKRFILLPVILIAVLTGALFILWPHLNSLIPYAEAANAGNEMTIIWAGHKADLLGQIIIILAGVFGVLIFFKEIEKK